MDLQLWRPRIRVRNWFNWVKDMLKTVCLLGSAAGRNAGDAALISGIMEAIDKRLERRLTYKIPTLFPEFVKRSYTFNKVEAINVMPWTGSIKLFGLPTLKAVRESDLSLVFDAVLFDRDLFNPMFNFLSSLYFLLPAAKKAGRKVGLYNCGVGPIKTKLGAKMLKVVADSCDFITVRDQGSAEVLLKLGVPLNRIDITADAALNASAIPIEDSIKIIQSLGLPIEEEILAININRYLNTWSEQSSEKLTEDYFLSAMANAVSSVANKAKAPVLLVSTYHGDIELTQKFAKLLNLEVPLALIDNKRYDHYQLKGVLGRVGLLFAMRLHAMVLGSSEGTPIAGLAYQPKVQHYFDHAGISECCTDFRDFSAEKMEEFLSRAWNNRASIRGVLAEKMPELKRRALVAADRVAELDQADAGMSRAANCVV